MKDKELMRAVRLLTVPVDGGVRFRGSHKAERIMHRRLNGEALNNSKRRLDKRGGHRKGTSEYVELGSYYTPTNTATDKPSVLLHQKLEPNRVNPCECESPTHNIGEPLLHWEEVETVTTGKKGTVVKALKLMPEPKQVGFTQRVNARLVS